MDGGVPKIGPGFGAAQPARVAPRNDREREDANDFKEALEELRADPKAAKPSPSKPRTDLDVGYPTDDETGLSLDLKA